jgi:hypothetical protein
VDIAGGRLVLDVGAREVLRDIHEDRAGAAGARQVEGLVHRLGDLQRVLDHERVLDDRQRDAARVALLKAVGADQLRANLACDEHGRHRVEHRVGDRSDEVGGARAGRAEGDADAPGRLGVALGRVAAAGLVAHEDVADASVVEGVVGGQVRAAGQAEDDLDALGLQALHQGIGGSHAMRVYQRFSGAPAGNSSSVPQLVQSASWRFTTRPHPGQRRTGSSRSKRYSSAASRPPIGSSPEIRNQSTNELPLILPTMPPASAKHSAMTTYATAVVARV